MKKNLISTMAVSALAMLATSCSSELEGLTAGNNAKEMKHVTFTATQETSGSSKTRTTLADGFAINWEQNDQVMVFDGTDYHPFTALQYGGTTTALDGSVCAEATSFSAYYMGSSYSGVQSTLTISLPEEQTATTNSFDKKANLMYAPQKEGFTLNFKNACSYIKLTTTKEYTKIVLTADVNIAGDGSIESVGDSYSFVPSTTEGATVSKTVTLVPATDGGKIEAGTYYIAIAPVTATALTTDCYTSDAQYDELALTGSFTLARGTVNSLGKTSDNGWKAVDKNLVSFYFQVNDKGKKVQFTRSNLCCNTTTTPVTWSLAANVTDYTTAYTPANVDHFFWTTYADFSSGTLDYMPYTEIYGKSSYNENDEFWCGENHPLTVDGTIGLYTLSGNEWDYIHNRASETDEGEETKYENYGVTINGISGCMVLAPDGNSVDIASEYTAEEWAEAEKNYGFVCFPPCGYIVNGSFHYDGIVTNAEVSIYHSSSLQSGFPSCQNWSHASFFNSSEGGSTIIPINYKTKYPGGNRQYAGAVRLVKTVSE